jgi:hypothetical protein
MICRACGFSPRAASQPAIIASLASVSVACPCTIPARSYRASAASVRPVARSRVACCCQASRCRRTSVISTAPTRSAIARNAAPASIACNCSGSPTSTTFAPADSARDNSRSICREPIIPASSTTSTSQSASTSLPCSHWNSRLCTVRLAIPAPASSCSAAMPDSAAPRT